MHLESSTLEEDESIFAAIWREPRLFAYSIALAATALLFGYEPVFVGLIAAVPYFQYVFHTIFEECPQSD